MSATIPWAIGASIDARIHWLRPQLDRLVGHPNPPTENSFILSFNYTFCVHTRCLFAIIYRGQKLRFLLYRDFMNLRGNELKLWGLLWEEPIIERSVHDSSVVHGWTSLELGTKNICYVARTSSAFLTLGLFTHNRDSRERSLQSKPFQSVFD